MKKRLVSLLVALSILASVCAASAAPGISPRWTFLREINILINMEGNSLYWGAVAECYYELPHVTDTAINIALQEANNYGWVTIDSDSVKMSGKSAHVGNYYKNWTAGKSYRIKVEVWAYQNNVKLEYAGPVYQYYNT